MQDVKDLIEHLFSSPSKEQAKTLIPNPSELINQMHKVKSSLNRIDEHEGRSDRIRQTVQDMRGRPITDVVVALRRATTEANSVIDRVTSPVHNAVHAAKDRLTGHTLEDERNKLVKEQNQLNILIGSAATLENVFHVATKAGIFEQGQAKEEAYTILSAIFDHDNHSPHGYMELMQKVRLMGFNTPGNAHQNPEVKYDAKCLADLRNIDVEKFYKAFDETAVAEAVSRVVNPTTNSSALTMLMFDPYPKGEINTEQVSRIANTCVQRNISLPLDTAELLGKRPSKEVNFNTYKNFQKKLPQKISPNLKTNVVRFAYFLGLFEVPDKAIDIGKGKSDAVSNQAFNVLQQNMGKKVSIEALAQAVLPLRANDFDNIASSISFLTFFREPANLAGLIEVAKTKQDAGEIFKFALTFFSEEDKKPASDINRGMIPVRRWIGEEGNQQNPRRQAPLEYKKATPELLYEHSKSINARSAEEEHIAEFARTVPGYKQEHFEKIVDINEERERSGVPDHILKEPLKIEVGTRRDYINQVEALDNEFLKEAGMAVSSQSEIANIAFTSEMLAKSKLANFAMGTFTSCCANIMGAGSGAQRAMIVCPDIQPLAIKDPFASEDDKKLGADTKSFGIIYVNRKKGYAVVNDFEANKDFFADNYLKRDSEKELQIKKQRRDILHQAGMEGVDAFATQYNSENSDNQIKKINCSLSPNWEGFTDEFNLDLQMENTMNNFIRTNPLHKAGSKGHLEAPHLKKWSYPEAPMHWDGDWHGDQYEIWNAEKGILNKEGRTKQPERQQRQEQPNATVADTELALIPEMTEDDLMPNPNPANNLEREAIRGLMQRGAPAADAQLRAMIERNRNNPNEEVRDL